MFLRSGFACLFFLLIFPVAAMAHGPKAVPTDGELLARHQAAFSAYQNGQYAKALEEWQPVAEGGFSAAQLFIGFIYEIGQGVEADQAAAAGWYRKAAERDNMIAQVRLALMYRDGRGVAADSVEAWVWAGMASRTEDHMHRIGQAMQRELAKAMTADQRAEAEKRLAAQMDKH